jgi:hypothetical protein
MLKLNALKYLLTLLSIIIISSCGLIDNSNSFNPNKLKGKYTINIEPLVEKIMTDKTQDENIFVQEMAKSLMASIGADVTFYEDKKGFMELNGDFLNLLKLFSTTPINERLEFEYEIRKDSLLYLKEKGKGNFEDYSTIRSFSPDYKYITLAIENPFSEGNKKMTLDLIKQ